MAHKRLSASGSSCWMNCPGQPDFKDVLVVEGKLKEGSESSVYAMEGTAAHHLINVCLMDLLAGDWGISAEKYRGCAINVESLGNECIVHYKLSGTAPDEPPEGWARFEVDDDMIWACDVMIGYIRRRLEELGATAKDGLPPDVRVDLEEQCNLGFLGREDLGGTVDVRITQMLGIVEIVDYKHGRGVAVYPEENPQLLIYAGGGDCGLEDGCGDARLTIVQPRCAENEAIASWDPPGGVAYVRDWLRTVLVPAAEACEAEHVNLVPGPTQCKWCRCMPFCDAAAEAATQLALTEFNDLDAQEGLPTPNEVAERFVIMAPERVAQFLGLAPLLDAAVKAATKRAMDLLRSGAPVPGFKLVASQSKRRWVADAEEKLAGKRVPKRVSHKQTLVSFTMLEKAEGGKYKALVEGLTEKPDGKPTLVPECDKRPALPPPAQQDFSDLDEEDLLS
jgi:hypothetical protein